LQYRQMRAAANWPHEVRCFYRSPEIKRLRYTQQIKASLNKSLETTTPRNSPVAGIVVAGV
jgi:hypothetical protein